MNPSIGRIVHYASRDKGCRAAIVTDVVGEQCWLAVFDSPSVAFTGATQASLGFTGVAQYSESREPGTWHWPERVE